MRVQRRGRVLRAAKSFLSANTAEISGAERLVPPTWIQPCDVANTAEPVFGSALADTSFMPRVVPQPVLA